MYKLFCLLTYLLTDGAGMQGLMSKCPFMQNTMISESGREEAVDIAVAAQAVLSGILFHLPVEHTQIPLPVVRVISTHF